MEESELPDLMEDIELFRDTLEEFDFLDKTDVDVAKADLQVSQGGVDVRRSDAFVGGQASCPNDSTQITEEDFAFVDNSVVNDVPERRNDGKRMDNNPGDYNGGHSENNRLQFNAKETARASAGVGGSGDDHAARILNALRKGDGHVSKKSKKSRKVEELRVFKRAEEIRGPFYSMRMPSTGEMLYLRKASRCSEAAKIGRSERSEGGGLLEAPIGDMVEECRKEMVAASISQTERIVERMHVDPLAFGQPPGLPAEKEGGSGDRGSAALPWVGKYTPQKYGDLLTDEKMNRDVIKWMKAWDPIVFGKKNGRNACLTSSSDRQTPDSKVILLSGPPGGGKTTLAKVISRHCGYRPLVVNASDDRTKSILETKLHDATAMKSVLGERKPNCVILDEVDGMVMSEGQGAIDTVLKLVQQGSKRADTKADETGKNRQQKRKKQKKFKPLARPLICICNDLYSPVLKNLRAAAKVFQFKGAKIEQLLGRLTFICSQEGVQVSRKTLQALIEKSNSDIRVCLNTLQYLAARNPVIHTADVENASVGAKDLKESCFDVWGQLLFQRSSSKKRSSSGIVLYKTLQDFGEFDLMCDGVLENIQCNRFMDPLLEKTSGAVENLARGAWFSHAAGFGLTEYLPAYLISATKEVGSVQRFKLTWPTKEFNLSRSLKANRSLLDSWKSKLSPKVLARNMGCTAVLDLIPALKRVLTPSIYPISSESMSFTESSQIRAFAGIMWQYGLTYDLSLSNQAGGPAPGGSRKVRSFIPAIHEFHQYGRGDVLPTSQITMQTVNIEIDKLRKSRMGASSRGRGASKMSSVEFPSPVMGFAPQAGPSQRDALDFEKENDVEMASSSGRQLEGHMGGNGGSVGGGSSMSFGKKRKGNWLETHRRNQRSKLMERARIGKRPPVMFLYDEGKTDSVRRAATLRDFA